MEKSEASSTFSDNQGAVLTCCAMMSALHLTEVTNDNEEKDTVALLHIFYLLVIV